MSSGLKMMSTKACFGAGCYWGTEKFIIKDFNTKYPKSIKDGKVGFMGPTTSKPNPSYREVCSGTTGHVEVYDCEFDGDEGTYEELVKHFFMFHDPTTQDAQGNDRGTQYSSVLYCYDQKQKEIAQKVKSELQTLLSAGKNLRYKEKTVKTDIRDATTFYVAQGDHQEYLANNPYGYCNHAYRFTEWPV